MLEEMIFKTGMGSFLALPINFFNIFLDHPIGAAFDLAITLIQNILHTIIQ